MVAPRRHRDMYVAASLGPDAPEGGGALMAEDGIGPAGQDRRHPPALLGQIGAADCVHASMHWMETADVHPVPDRIVGIAKRRELEEGNDPVLPRSEGPCPPGPLL